MDNVFRYSIDKAVEVLSSAFDSGITTTILFPCVEPQDKNLEASEAYNPKGLIQEAITKDKISFTEIRCYH